MVGWRTSSIRREMETFKVTDHSLLEMPELFNGAAKPLLLNECFYSLLAKTEHLFGACTVTISD